MGRTHSLEDFDNLITMIRNHGISNINADIMLGYPNQSLKAVQDTITHLTDLNIPHIFKTVLSFGRYLTPLSTIS